MSDNISPSKVAASNKKNSGKKHGGLLKFIVLHPAIAFVIVVSTLAIAIALIAFLLYSANVQMDTILKMYTSLTARVQDSKSEFNKKKYYITVDEQGITHITVRLDTGFDTEYDEYGNPIEDDEDDNPGGGENTGDEDGPTGDENLDTVQGRKDYIWKYLKNLGYDDYAASGIMGNMWTETGGTFDPKITSPSGYVGICQWGTAGNRKGNLQSRSNWDTIPVQCDFMKDEIASLYPNCKTGVLNDPYSFSSKDSTVSSSCERVEVCTYIFCRYYEGCVTGATPRNFANASNAYQGFNDRKKNAKSIFNEYHK